MVLQQQLTKSLEKHQFAFYSPSVVLLLKKSLYDTFEITEVELVHRVVRVVKLSLNEHFVLFNRQQNVTIKLLACTKRSLTVQVLSVEDNQQLQPHIVFLLPLLKKDALESALYSLAEMGVNEIRLIVTEKSRQKLVSEKEFQRLQNILIAAAEQSKYFAFPELHAPKKAASLLSSLGLGVDKILFDATGDSFFDVREKTVQSKMYLTVGPEGGFTSEELHSFTKYGFAICALTKTVLRSVQAVAVSAALFRL